MPLLTDAGVAGEALATQGLEAYGGVFAPISLVTQGFLWPIPGFNWSPCDFGITTTWAACGSTITTGWTLCGAAPSTTWTDCP